MRGALWTRWVCCPCCLLPNTQVGASTRKLFRCGEWASELPLQCPWPCLACYKLFLSLVLHIYIPSTHFSICKDLVRQMLFEGRRGALKVYNFDKKTTLSPASLGFTLMYQWHGELYLGAIHDMPNIIMPPHRKYEVPYPICNINVMIM